MEFIKFVISWCFGATAQTSPRRVGDWTDIRKCSFAIEITTIGLKAGVAEKEISNLFWR
jgi:hypothetical protein